MVSQVTALARAALPHRIAAPAPADPAQFGQPLELAGSGPPPAVAQLHTLVLAPGASVQVQQAWRDLRSDALALREAQAAGAYGLASMAPVGVLTPTPPKHAVEDVSTLGFLPGGNTRADAVAAFRAEAADLRDAARREQQLSDRLGVDVKLGYDPDAGREVALQPGDPGYDALRGARTDFARLRQDLGRMGMDLADFADLLDL